MKRASYGERDYAFGQLMLTLRMTIGLTQAGLAEKLQVSRHAVGGWEAGQSYPKATHLKAFIALSFQQGVFDAGREAEEIRALWRAAHQKVLLDELWLQEVLSPQRSPLVPVAVEPPSGTNSVGKEPRVDWGDALDVPVFYGRAEELALLDQWVVEEGCRVVSILGMGGIGKSALAVTFMHRVAKQFEVVIWRSLRDAPSYEGWLDGCLQVLALSPLSLNTASLEQRITLLMGYMRDQRVLLVLDNLEMLLEEGEGMGRIRAGFEGYASLLRRMGETAHQSCLLLTSREKPAELVPLEGSRSSVRALRLVGLDAHAGIQVLTEKDVVSAPQDQARLVEVYQGNPLALKIVAQTIVELFGGEIVPFLEQGEVFFGGVWELLSEQFDRLSALEQNVFYWLAILREPVSLEELLAILRVPRAPMHVLEALDRLRRRSLIEQGQRTGSFTQQSVVLEYATARLITQASNEIMQGQLVSLIEYGLCQAQAKEYVRKAQEQLLVVPLLTRLQVTYQGQAEMEAYLLKLVAHLQGWDQTAQGYGPANLVTLLRMLRGDLRGLDLSHLALRGVYLQNVEMQDTTLSDAILQNSVFAERFDGILTVAISSNGAYWAIASRRGEIRVWEKGGLTLRHTWQAHLDIVWHLAFNPDGRSLASAGSDGSIKLWDIVTGTLLRTTWLTRSVTCLAFSPDGALLASGGLDAIVRLWDTQHGTLIEELRHTSAVFSLTWNPVGRRLVGGGSDGSIWVWELQEAEHDTNKQVLIGHTHWVTGLAFSPDEAYLASASFDKTIKLWDIASGDCLQTFSGHTDRVMRVAWSPDGYTLASCSVDHTIRLWDIKEGRSWAVLRGHSGVVTNLAFTPDSRTLLSSSDDGTIRVWDVESKQCLRTIGGYVASFLDIDWSPDGTQLVCSGTDALVTIWDSANVTAPRVLRGHCDSVPSVAWHPAGRLLASGGHDGIGLWDIDTGVCLQMLQDPDAANTIFQGVAWSPDGHLLIGGSYLRGVQVWKMPAAIRHWIGQTQQPTRIRHVAWSPDGMWLVGGDDDGIVYVWNDRGTLQLQLARHNGAVMSVAWSPDGTRLASSGNDRERGELFVWDAHNGKLVQTLVGYPGLVYTVAWSPNGEMLISGSSDGNLRWWEIASGECVRVQEAHHGTVQALKVSPDGTKLASCGDDGTIVLWDVQSGERLQMLRRDRPYERLNITGIKGVTEAQKASLQALGAFEETIN